MCFLNPCCYGPPLNSLKERKNSLSFEPNEPLPRDGCGTNGCRVSTRLVSDNVELGLSRYLPFTLCSYYPNFYLSKSVYLCVWFREQPNWSGLMSVRANTELYNVTDPAVPVRFFLAEPSGCRRFYPSDVEELFQINKRHL